MAVNSVQVHQNNRINVTYNGGCFGLWIPIF